MSNIRTCSLLLTSLFALSFAQLFITSVAHAIPIVQTLRYSLPSVPSGAGSISAPLLVNSFDASVGTLDSVNLLWSGTITSSFLLPSNFTVADGGAPIPVPYTYNLSIRNSIGGTGDLSSMSFLNDSTQIFSGTSPGGNFSTPLVFQYAFSHNVTLTEFTDLSGFAPVTDLFTLRAGDPGARSSVPSAFLTGVERSDFASSLPIQLLLPSHSVSSLLIGNGGLLGGSLQVNSAVSITYNYTSSDFIVSEPGVVGLLAIGFVGLFFAKRRKT